MLTAPPILLAWEFVITAAVLGFTKRDFWVRIACLPLMIACTWSSVIKARGYMKRGPWAALVGGYCVTYLYQYITLVLLVRLNYEERELETVKQLPANGEAIEKEASKGITKTDHFVDRLNFGIKAASTFRWSKSHGTPSPRTLQPHKPVSERRTFMLHAVTKIFCCYLILDLMSLGIDEDVNAIRFSPTRITFFTRLNKAPIMESFLRLFATIGFGFGVYCTQTMGQNLLAIVAVSQGMSEPEEFPPGFGSLTEAHTLRRFWRYVFVY